MRGLSEVHVKVTDSSEARVKVTDSSEANVMKVMTGLSETNVKGTG